MNEHVWVENSRLHWAADGGGSRDATPAEVFMWVEVESLREEVRRYKAWAASCDPTPPAPLASKVTRYTARFIYGDDVTEDAEGEYVTYAAYEELANELSTLRAPSSLPPPVATLTSKEQVYKDALEHIVKRGWELPPSNLTTELMRIAQTALVPAERSCDHKKLTTVNADGFCLICGTDVMNHGPACGHPNWNEPGTCRTCREWRERCLCGRGPTFHPWRFCNEYRPAMKTRDDPHSDLPVELNP